MRSQLNKEQVRVKAIRKAQQFWNKTPVFLDTETTGIDPQAEIVEITVINHQGQVLLDTLVKPVHKIPREAMNVHHITNTMVKKAPTWVEVWPEVAAILSEQRVGIYNAEFDLRLLKQSHEQAGLDWGTLGAKAFCIMKLYAEFYGEWQQSRNSYRWQSLTKAGTQCGINIPNSHRAKDDTLLARAVLEYMANARE